jgi:hypothetical protein
MQGGLENTGLGVLVAYFKSFNLDGLRKTKLSTSTNHTLLKYIILLLPKLLRQFNLRYVLTVFFLYPSLIYPQILDHKGLFQIRIVWTAIAYPGIRINEEVYRVQSCSLERHHFHTPHYQRTGTGLSAILVRLEWHMTNLKKQRADSYMHTSISRSVMIEENGDFASVY